MEDVIVGILAVIVGALFCFRGYLAMRVIIPIWGAFAGFILGAGLVANATGDTFLSTLASWLVGLGLAIAFGALAYFYYEISVLFAMAAIGFALGSSLMVALDVTWSWLIVLVGVLVGALLAVVAIVGDMPTVLLVVLSAAAGASVIIGGILLLVGTLQNEDFNSGSSSENLNLAWWWFVIYGVLVVVGIVAQVRAIETLRGSIRDQWAVQGGRSLRSVDSV